MGTEVLDKAKYTDPAENIRGQSLLLTLTKMTNMIWL